MRLSSGTEVVRPSGQLQKNKENPKEGSTYGPCRLLDFELEMAFFVGTFCVLWIIDHAPVEHQVRLKYVFCVLWIIDHAPVEHQVWLQYVLRAYWAMLIKHIVLLLCLYNMPHSFLTTLFFGRSTILL